MAHHVERAGLDQRFDGLLVADHRVDLGQEVVEVGVLAFLLAAAHDRGDDVRADVADGGEAEPDVLADGGERPGGGVHVGRQDLDAHPPALRQIERHLVLVVADGGEQPGHVLGRVVRLQVRRPVGDQAVRGGVGLVEGVPGERDQHVPHGLDGLVGVTAFAAAVPERAELLVEDLLLLLAHRPAQQVGLAEGVAGQDLRGALHLLLIDDQAVGGARISRSGSSSCGWIGVISWRPFLRSA